MLYIGVDLGTSAVKLLLMQTDGTIKKIVSKEYPLSFPKPGWSEQNPAFRSWWQRRTKARWQASASAGRCMGWWRLISMTR